MTCVVVNLHPHFDPSLAYAQATATCTSPKLAETLFMPPSALHTKAPGQQDLLEFCNGQQGDANEQAKAAALLGGIPPSLLPSAERSLELEVISEDPSPSHPAPAAARGRGRRAPGHTTLREWAKKFAEQPVEPPWWETSLASSIHQTLREREAAIGDIQFKSPQLDKRQYLVDYLLLVCQRLFISHGTRFLAIKLMDHFMDKHVVMDYRMKLVALTCLLVAAKFEEADENLPTIEMMIQLAQLGPGPPDYYTREEFQKMELYLLRFFDWSVSFPSSAHFANYYLHYGSSCEEGVGVPAGVGRKVDAKQLKEDMETYSTHFLEAALRDYTFLQFMPSQVAAAAVCASRMCVGISTAWTSELESVTGYSLEELHPIVDGMLKLLSA